jgi:tRNA modification GTPase
LAEDAQGLIEGEGIRRALERAQRADLKLLVFDATVLPEMDAHTRALIDAQSIVVMNKSDRAVHRVDGLAVSALTGLGLETLLAEIVTQVEFLIGRREAPSLTRQRHRLALQDCSASLGRAMLGDRFAPELMAEDVRLAMRALGRITGRVDVEELLDIIFRDFCIGK